MRGAAAAAAIAVSCVWLPAAASFAAGLQLAVAGKTDYQIVLAADAADVDRYAAETLAGYLRQITSAEFPVVASDAINEDRPALFVGLSEPALRRLGGDPRARLEDQEHVSRSKGRDIFLYGRGVHGNLHAAMEFLHSSLGWRWYSVFEKPVVAPRTTVSLEPFERKRGFAFKFRELPLRYDQHFYRQHGLNMASEHWGTRPRSGFPPLLRNDKFVHGSLAYIPPAPEAREARTFAWLEKKDYFATHPDFFSMNAAGRRVASMQLCFANPALRRELTRNILRHIAAAPGNDIITVDAADTPGAFCYCPGCKALEEKYQCPGGPIFDCLIELCGLLEKEHPGKLVRTLAYRRSQTQKPPVLPGGGRLPDNLIISFAPIEDCFFADWRHPDARIQETYRDLEAWRKITSHLWAWLYPNPWGTGEVLPVGNLRRNIHQMRLMHQAGVEGLFADHRGVLERSGLSELQTYLIIKLMQDVACDTDAIIRAFTEHHYGPAAGLVRRYLDELEQGREAIRELPPEVTYTSGQRDDDRTFPYLTVANIRRWQGYFDQMESEASGSPADLANIRLLRRELDFASLWKWFPLREAHPEYFRDPAVFASRIVSANAAKAAAGMTPRPLAPAALDDLLAVIEGGGKEKPLPPELEGIDRSRIQTFVPTNTAGQAGPWRIRDPDAARGYAATVHLPDLPFQVGFYQWESRQPAKGTQGARIRLERKDIVAGKYRLYRLGTITITPDSWVWFSARSWATHQQLGERLHEPGTPNRWEAWVSLKFDGPTYGGTAAEDRVLCDRIIVVKQF